MTISERIDTFLDAEAFGVVGASTKPHKYGKTGLMIPCDKTKPQTHTNTPNQPKNQGTIFFEQGFDVHGLKFDIWHQWYPKIGQYQVTGSVMNDGPGVKRCTTTQT